MTPVRLEPAASQSRVKHSITEPLRSLHYLCEDRIEKSVPRDHYLSPDSPFGKPRDAKQCSLGRILLSHPHTHDEFL